MVLVDTHCGWFVDWVRDVDPKKPGLDFVRELDVLGGWFGTGKDTPAVPPGLKFSAGVPDGLPPPVASLTGGQWMDEVFPWMMPVVYDGPKRSLAKGNPSAATLTCTAKTGIFKGSFKLYYDGWDAKGKLQRKAVNVPYTGAMVPDNGELRGLGTGTATIGNVKYGMPVFLEQ